MDGVIATKKIRALDPTSLNFDTPIIALTADIQPSVSKKFRRAGANDTLLKPFTRKNLSNCINRWIHKKSDRNDTHQQSTDIDDIQVLFRDQPLDELYQMMPNEGVEVVKRVIGLYCQKSPGLIAKIQQGLTDNNNEILFEAAHSLKSSSGNVGAQKVQHLARQLEQLGRNNQIGGAQSLVTELEMTFQETKGALNKKLSEYA